MTVKQETSFAEQLRRFRETAGFTQEQLAERANLSAKAISALERGERQRPYPTTVQMLASALELSPQERTTLIASVPKRSTNPAPLDYDTERVPFPTLPAKLFGRETDIARLTALLDDSSIRLVTLLGPGGVGKTVLSIQVARTCAAHFVDGVVFVELAPLDSAEHVIPAVGEALGLHEAGTQPIRAVLHRFLQNRQVFLVLDNFEHVLEAAAEVSTLLAISPASKILVTSRATLRLREEQEYPVAPLTLLDGVGQEVASPAVQLFVQRVQAVDSRFALTETNAGTIAAICKQLDGLPLTIELAAARTKLFGLAGLLRRLEQSLSILTDGPRDLPVRQQTMRQTIAWSYNLLTPDEQKLFRSLGVFVGSWTLAAAEEICQGVDVLEGLSSLLDKSLLLRSDFAEAEPRFHLLETIRAYALEQLEAHGEILPMRRRHAAYYRKFVALAEPKLMSAEQPEWLDALMQDYPNIRATFEWYLSQRESETILTMGGVLVRFWYVRGGTTEAIQWIMRALHADPALSKDMQFLGVFAIGIMYYQRGETRQALDLLAQYPGQPEALDIQIPAYLVRGLLDVSRGDLRQAKLYFDQALQAARTLQSDAWAGIALRGQGHVAADEGDFVTAFEFLSESERLLRNSGMMWELAVTLNTQAILQQFAGKAAQSALLLCESLTISRDLQDIFALPFAFEALGNAAALENQYKRAAQLWGAAEMLREKHGVQQIGSERVRVFCEELASVVRGILGLEVMKVETDRGYRMTLEQALAFALGE